ncbi:MAG: GNAT family N-acetyltransferase [Candidatus Aenigmatarchaeota archaeon]|nr:MAG: GNAT family N-acetyltransferase [Candidatus Aenigmarchaeota archaeon]
MFQKIRLLRQCFPDSWIRKLVFLIYPTHVIKRDNMVVAFLTVRGKEILLLAVDKKYRGGGIASELIKKTKANYVYTYKNNKAAIKFYIKNDFRVAGEKKTPFGEKVRLERK